MSDVIRRVRAEEGNRLRELRLLALQEAPEAFARTFAEESAYPAEFWSERARAASAGDRSANFVVERDERWVGIVGGYRPEASPEAVELVSMWIAPEARGGGVSRRLVETLVDWARAIAAPRVELWVAEGNEVAERLYARCGFALDGGEAPFPSDPDRTEYRMSRVP